VAPNVHLSTLGISELRRLLEVARAREQNGLAEQILAELDARRRPAPGDSHAMRPSGGSTPDAARAPRGRGVGATLAAGALALIAGGLAWGWTGLPLELQRAPAPAPARPAVPPAAPEPERLAVALSQPAQPETPPPQVETAPTGAPVAVAASHQPAAPGNPCYALSTAAERLVCGYPSLAIQQQRLEAAYRRALDASQDPIEIGREHAAWRATIAKVSDRAQLSAAFEQRIQALEAERERESSPPF
jgi:hypothetical protein